MMINMNWDRHTFDYVPVWLLSFEKQSTTACLQTWLHTFSLYTQLLEVTCLNKHCIVFYCIVLHWFAMYCIVFYPTPWRIQPIRRLEFRCIFSLLVFILTRPTGSSKYSATRKNTQRYYIPERLIRHMYCLVLYCIVLLLLHNEAL